MSVAIIGPDGAGKSTLVQALQAVPTLPTLMIYMGTNPESTNYSLPTLRWMHRRSRRRRLAPATTPGQPPQSRSTIRRVLRVGREMVGLVHQLLEYSYRFLVGAAGKRRGAVVVFDRYIYDGLIDLLVEGLPPWQQVRARLFAHVFPPPDLVLILDAPGAVLFARKGEHSPERLERVRQACYEVTRRLPHVEAIDVTQPPAKVLQDAVEIIQRHRKSAR
jgi:thymidylate kinase